MPSFHSEDMLYLLCVLCCVFVPLFGFMSSPQLFPRRLQLFMRQFKREFIWRHKWVETRWPQARKRSVWERRKESEGQRSLRCRHSLSESISATWIANSPLFHCLVVFKLTFFRCNASDTLDGMFHRFFGLVSAFSVSTISAGTLHFELHSC